MSVADTNKPGEKADKANKVKEQQETIKQYKQIENSKEKKEEEYNSELMLDSETEASCDLEEGGEKIQDDIIPNPETGGAEALKCALCDLSYEPAGRHDPNSALRSRWRQKTERISGER